MGDGLGVDELFGSDSDDDFVQSKILCTQTIHTSQVAGFSHWGSDNRTDVPTGELNLF